MQRTDLVEAYISLRRSHNDLRVMSGTEVNPAGFVLLAVLRNEMYFLPAFLSHYRLLGVERFVFLNDRSDDGSFEYLLQQPDVTVVASNHTYSDTFEVSQNLSNKIRTLRILYLWRAMLHDMFAQDQWALQVDLDEFVHLPENVTFPQIVSHLEKQDARAAWGVMLDVYPKDITALTELEQETRLNIAQTWYFDGEKHLHLRRNGKPNVVHPGARARLYCAYGVDRLYPTLGIATQRTMDVRRRLSWLDLKPIHYNALQKPLLLRWSKDSYFRNSHMTNIKACNNCLLPIQHFRFAGGINRKIRAGIEERSYYRNSTDHRLLEKLLQKMEEQKGSFLYRKSRPLESFADFAETGNAMGV